MAILAALVDGVVGGLQTRQVMDLALELRDCLLHRRDLGLEVGLVLPDLR